METGYYNIKDGDLIKVEPSINKGTERLVILFSCGITSFIATLLALEENKKRWHLPAYIIYTYVKEEPKDNLRFLEDAEKHFKQKVLILKNEDYNGSIYEVFKKTRWLVGVKGARCTTELKWRVRKEFVTDQDVQVFGFNAGEEDRMDKFANANNDINISCPLICRRLTKKDCLLIAGKMGIEVPDSYKRGYKNANCIGCVKGQAGYWNHVRRMDIDVFNKMAGVERDLNAAINKSYKGDGKRKRVFLDELDPEAGRHSSIDLPDCGVLCELEQGLKK